MQENIHDQTEAISTQQRGEEQLATPLHALLHVQEYAIVRVNDGRLGYKTHVGRQH